MSMQEIINKLKGSSIECENTFYKNNHPLILELEQELSKSKDTGKGSWSKFFKGEFDNLTCGEMKKIFNSELLKLKKQEILFKKTYPMKDLDEIEHDLYMLECNRTSTDIFIEVKIVRGNDE